MTCTGYRGVSERIDHMLANPPGDPGWCAREVWHALGGNLPSPCPPAWGKANANECYDAIKASGRYFTSTPIPDGAAIYWKYGSNGHAALAWQGGICTTDPEGDPGGTGLEGLDYPHRWGANSQDRIWTDEYNGVRFSVGDSADSGPFVTNHVYRSKCGFGQTDSDTVRELQERLNRVSLEGGQELPVTGDYLEQTDHEVRLWQEQICGDKPDPAGLSYLGPEQFKKAFPSTVYTQHDDGDPAVAGAPEPPETPDPEPPGTADPPGVSGEAGLWKWYSGKDTDAWVLHPDGDWHDIPGFVQPVSGVTEDNIETHFLYLRVLLPAGRSADRVLEVRFIRSDGDETAYDHRTLGLKKDSYPFPSIHVESGSGLGGRWQAKVTGGTDPIEITTRYAKTYVQSVSEAEAPLSYFSVSTSRDLVRWAAAVALTALALRALQRRA